MNHPVACGKPVVVVCAIIERGDTFLAALRGRGQSNAGLWEFPGGKVQAEETPPMALRRELREELGMEAAVVRALPEVHHTYPWMVIDLVPFICTIRKGEPQPHEHAAVRWVSMSEARTLHWSPADIPVLQSYCTIRRSPA
ncbi:MAG: (deoxy)nucleoside triphosphate pyrophosphohydrolase [Chitinispirillaceae bacterium]